MVHCGSIGGQAAASLASAQKMPRVPHPRGTTKITCRYSWMSQAGRGKTNLSPLENHGSRGESVRPSACPKLVLSFNLYKSTYPQRWKQNLFPSPMKRAHVLLVSITATQGRRMISSSENSSELVSLVVMSPPAGPRCPPRSDQHVRGGTHRQTHIATQHPRAPP